jgi:hypothetical protein
MTYCEKCGVELDNHMESCPLCGLNVGEKPELLPQTLSKELSYRNKIIQDIKNLTKLQKRKLFWEVTGIICVSGITVTLIINLIANKEVTWSKYVLISSLVLFSNISLFTFFRHKPFLLTIGTYIITAAMFVLLDVVSNNNAVWGTHLALPILSAFYLLLFILWWIIHVSNQHGFNILAILFIEIGLLLASAETFLSLYSMNEIRLHWSIITGVCILPIATLLFFVHYRLKAGIELKRFFHI